MLKTGEWLIVWMREASKTRFDATELYDIYHVKAYYDEGKGLAPWESVKECLEEIEDFISRYGGGEKC